MPTRITSKLLAPPQQTSPFAPKRTNKIINKIRRPRINN
jgi:hypothetical protein